MRYTVPWWGKIFAKIILARLPISYNIWKKLGLFEHGKMDRPQRAWETFVLHARLASVLTQSSSATFLHTKKTESFNILELGPGDSLFSSLIAYSLGANKTWLVDTGRWAMNEIRTYYPMCEYLRNNGLLTVDLDGCRHVDDLLLKVSANYLVNGIQSLTKIPSESIDFCFSNAVLEHVEKSNFSEMVRELFRVLKPNGVSSHRVDLKDHLGGSLNNLRFAEKLWEGNLFKPSGFYTNRIRYSDMTNMFRIAGFKVSCPRVSSWDKMPINRSKLHETFRNLPEKELLISGFDMILTKPA